MTDWTQDKATERQMIYLADLIERNGIEVKVRDDLTKGEASEVIDALKAGHTVPADAIDRSEGDPDFFGNNQSDAGTASATTYVPPQVTESGPSREQVEWELRQFFGDDEFEIYR